MRCAMLKTVNGKPRCRALNPNLRTDCRHCGFYVTKEQYAASLERSNRRINSLPHDVQMTIAENYYGGKMPWRQYDRLLIAVS